MVGFAQWWKNDICFIDPQGNVGSIQGKTYAAQRYLELKLSNSARDLLFEDVEKEVVDMLDNYDKTKKIPSTLPTKFPAILNTGMMGIGSGFASDIPIHSIANCCQVALHKLANPKADSLELAKVLGGPDFPTGGEITNAAELPKMYAEGIGNIKIRGVIEEEKRGSKNVLVIREIPPRKTTGKIMEEISDLCKDKDDGNKKKVPGILQDKISDIQDFTSKKSVEIVIFPKKDVSLPVLKNMILEHTSMTFSHKYMMNVLHNNKFINNASLEYVIEGWIEYRQKTVRRKYVYQVGKVLERISILKALIKALKNIDAVIAIVKKSDNKEIAINSLKKNYNFADKEARYIVEQPIYRLTGFEIGKLETELDERKIEADNYISILKDSTKINVIIKDELMAVEKKYKSPRRTKLMNVGKVTTIDMIEKKKLIIAITSEGFVFSKEVDEVRDGSRGNKGQLFVDSKRGRSIEKSVLLDSHDELFVISEDGKLFKANAFEFDVNNVHVSNVIKNFGERGVCSFIPVSPDDKGDLIFVTSSSLTKRVSLDDFRTRNMPQEGLLAVSLVDGEKLIGVIHSEKPEDDIIVISTSRGYASKIIVDNLAIQRRPSMGRKMIRMKEDEECVSLVSCSFAEEENTSILFITTKGKGKLVKVSDLLFKKTDSGQSASFLAIKLRKEDHLRKNVICAKSEQLVVCAKSGKTVRLDSSEVTEMKREAMGYTIISLNEGDEVASVLVA